MVAAAARLVSALLMAAVMTHSNGSPLPEDSGLVVTTTGAYVSDEPGSTSVPEATTAKVEENVPPKILAMNVYSDIRFRFATTLITSRVANPSERSQEITFAVVLPQDAFITSFVMDIDGTAYPAHVEEKQKAQGIFDSAKQQGVAAAHVAYKPRDSNSFDVSVNVEPLKKVTFNLTYEELLQREPSDHLYHHIINISPGQVVPAMKVKVHILEPRHISMRLPDFTSGNKLDDAAEDRCDGGATDAANCTSGNEIARKTCKSAQECVVEFEPTEQEQKRLARGKGLGLSGQFKVLYDVQRDSTGGEILVKDGYFVHFFAPTELGSLPKHVVFVLDVSGSMSGRKITQLKDAMKTILNALNSFDSFNVIEFSSGTKSWTLDFNTCDVVTRDSYSYRGSADETKKTEDVRVLPGYKATPENKEKALRRVDLMEADGGTNIYDALRQGLKTAQEEQKRVAQSGDKTWQKSIIMFLTDGDANVGESRPQYITSGLSDLNAQSEVPIYSLAFGEDGKIEFLKQISSANYGVAKLIYEGPDAAVQLRDFYKTISSPALSDVTFKYLPEQVDPQSTTKLKYHTYYNGGELAVVGKTADPTVQHISATVTAVSKDSPNKVYPVESLPLPEAELQLLDLVPPRQVNSTRPITSMERQWAYLTVKQLLEVADAEESRAKPREATDAPTTTTTPDNTAPTTVETPTTAALQPSTPSKPGPAQRALELAVKYSLVTKLTSLVVVKPNETQATDAQRVVSGDNMMPDGLYSRGAFPTLPLSSAQRYAAPRPHLLHRKTVGIRHGSPGAGVAFGYPMPTFASPPSNGHTLRAASSGGSLIAPGLTAVQYMQSLYPTAGPTGSAGGFAGFIGQPASASPTTPFYRPDRISEDFVPESPVSPRKLNISDVAWLPKDVVITGMYSLTHPRTDVSHCYRVFPQDAPSNSSTYPSCSTTGVSSGTCRPLSECVMEAVTYSLYSFVNYQCSLGDYLAVCCDE